MQKRGKIGRREPWIGMFSVLGWLSLAPGSSFGFMSQRGYLALFRSLNKRTRGFFSLQTRFRCPADSIISYKYK